MVAETNSFSRTAIELSMAQSTVSAHIKGLEDALGVQLFVRNAKKQVTATKQSKELYSYAKAIVEQCKTLSQEVANESYRQELRRILLSICCPDSWRIMQNSIRRAGLCCSMETAPSFTNSCTIKTRASAFAERR